MLPEAKHLLGMTWLGRGKWKNAQLEFKEAIKLYGGASSADSHFYLCVASWKLWDSSDRKGDKRELEQIFTEFSEKYPGDPRRDWVASLLSHVRHGEGRTKALLIGINEYAHASVPPLKGPANDVKMMQKTLMERFAFDEIIELRDEAATHEGILNEMRQLEIDASPNDQIVIYYSGHGMNPNQKTSSLLVPFDANPATESEFSQFITAEVFHQRLCKIAEKVAKVVVFWDSNTTPQFIRMVAQANAYLLVAATDPTEQSRELRINQTHLWVVYICAHQCIESFDRDTGRL